jgi:hypothetical protein
MPHNGALGTPMNHSPVSITIYRDPLRSSKGHFVKASGLRWLSGFPPCCW